MRTAHHAGHCVASLPELTARSEEQRTWAALRVQVVLLDALETVRAAAVLAAEVLAAALPPLGGAARVVALITACAASRCSA
jgi:hypothetical protein